MSLPLQFKRQGVACAQVHTCNAAFGEPGPGMTMQQFELYISQRTAAAPAPAHGSDSGSREHSPPSDETLDSSMATGSAAPGGATPLAPGAPRLPDKWLKHGLLLDGVPVHGSNMLAHVQVRAAMTSTTVAVTSVSERVSFMLSVQLPDLWVLLWTPTGEYA